MFHELSFVRPALHFHCSVQTLLNEARLEHTGSPGPSESGLHHGLQRNHRIEYINSDAEEGKTVGTVKGYSEDRVVLRV